MFVWAHTICHINDAFRHILRIALETFNKIFFCHFNGNFSPALCQAKHIETFNNKKKYTHAQSVLLWCFAYFQNQNKQFAYKETSENICEIVNVHGTLFLNKEIEEEKKAHIKIFVYDMLCYYFNDSAAVFVGRIEREL